MQKLKYITELTVNITLLTFLEHVHVHTRQSLGLAKTFLDSKEQSIKEKKITWIVSKLKTFALQKLI